MREELAGASVMRSRMASASEGGTAATVSLSGPLTAPALPGSGEAPFVVLEVGVLHTRNCSGGGGEKESHRLQSSQKQGKQASCQSQGSCYCVHFL